MMCIQVLQTIELIETYRCMEDDKIITLTMKDFFTKDELEHFLTYFTKPCQQITDRSFKLKWSSKMYDWPRVINKEIVIKTPVKLSN